MAYDTRRREGCVLARSAVFHVIGCLERIPKRCLIWFCLFCLAASDGFAASDPDELALALDKLETHIPLPYHDGLETTVVRMAGKPMSNTFLTESAMIDSALLRRGMPLELRYLPLAMSGMRQHYRQGDRRGVWQLPPLVGLRYGLAIDSVSDERLDAEAATNAALDYLNDLHDKYDNWWYSILAYMNSPVALHQALLREEETPQLWEFSERQLVPNTDIIADFIACVYLGEQDRLHFVEIAEPLPPKVIQPVKTASKKSVASSGKKASRPSGTRTIKYRIRKGDTLSHIARKYHVTVSKLKQWNHLKSDLIREGKTLTIKK